MIRCPQKLLKTHTPCVLKLALHTITSMRAAPILETKRKHTSANSSQEEERNVRSKPSQPRKPSQDAVCHCVLTKLDSSQSFVEASNAKEFMSEIRQSHRFWILQYLFMGTREWWAYYSLGASWNIFRTEFARCGIIWSFRERLCKWNVKRDTFVLRCVL